jgi:hypothetical protein
VQTPALQLPLPQFVPHAPQFCVSLEGLTHLPPQRTWGAGHTQAPLAQIEPPVQALPQALQCDEFHCKSTHSLPHCAYPCWQAHVPLLQTSWSPHACPHPPQCALSEFVSWHAPLQ